MSVIVACAGAADCAIQAAQQAAALASGFQAWAHSPDVKFWAAWSGLAALAVFGFVFAPKPAPGTAFDFQGDHYHEPGDDV